jgi:hypothetical protein
MPNFGGYKGLTLFRTLVLTLMPPRQTLRSYRGACALPYSKDLTKRPLQPFVECDAGPGSNILFHFCST